MPDTFDPYREALIVESTTIWPDEFDELDLAEKARIAESLHADPQKCAQIEYIRMHTGFCRAVTVTPEDVARTGGQRG